MYLICVSLGFSSIGEIEYNLFNSLYKLYLEGIENFEEKYIGLLKSGGSLKYSQLISTFGLDASRPGFWKSGLNVIENLIDELAAVELEG